MNEKIEILDLALTYATRENEVLETNIYPTQYNEGTDKNIMQLMSSFHTLDAFVCGMEDEGHLFGCGPANHWTVQVGFSESTPDIWQRKSIHGEPRAFAVVTYNRKGERKICAFPIREPLAEVYARLFFKPMPTGCGALTFSNSGGVITDE